MEMYGKGFTDFAIVYLINKYMYVNVYVCAYPFAIGSMCVDTVMMRFATLQSNLIPKMSTMRSTLTMRA